MAKVAGGINRRNLKAWFSGLDFENQKEILDDLGGVFEEGKAGQIQRLKAELAALTGEEVSVPRKQTATVPANAGKAKRGTKPGSKVPPKYIDKATGTTWAGRGVKPAWVEAHLKKGGKLEDLLISKAKKR